MTRIRTLLKAPACRRMGAGLLLAALLGCLMPGCGWLADEDRIVVAELDGEPITRGALFQLIREMDDNQRPEIRNRGDYLRVLNNYIDEEIKRPLGQDLDQKLEQAHRDALRFQAREEVFERNKDFNFREVYAMEVPADGVATPAMQTYDITARGLQNMKDLIEDQTDVVYERLLGNLAVGLMGQQAFEAQQVTITPEEIQREYALNQEQYQTFERLVFRAVLFPPTPDGAKEAAAFRTRLDGGVSFEDLFAECAAADSCRVIESEIENNPAIARFRGFWENAAGAEPGAVLGPIFLPMFRKAPKADESGKPDENFMPDVYLVLKVLERHAPAPMTLEEVLKSPEHARALLLPLCTARMMDRLRQDHGVKVFEDKLPEVGAAEE